MTADRWWVRAAARWLARIDGVAPHLRLGMLALTGVSTASLTLQQYGYGQYALPFIAGLSVGVVVYAYLYTEGGVWNQTARDRTDMSDNYSGPTMLMDNEIRRAQLAYVVAELTDKDHQTVNEELSAATRREWEAYRDGIAIENGNTRRMDA